MRPLRGSGFAFGQPDAFGAGVFPLRSFAMSQRRFNPLNGRLGLPSAGFEDMANSPSRQGRLSVVAAGRQGFASFDYGYIGGSLARSNVSYCISGLPKLIGITLYLNNSDGWQKTSANAPVRASRLSTCIMSHFCVFVAGGSILQTSSAEGRP